MSLLNRASHPRPHWLRELRSDALEIVERTGATFLEPYALARALALPPQWGGSSKAVFPWRPKSKTATTNPEPVAAPYPRKSTQGRVQTTDADQTYTTFVESKRRFAAPATIFITGC